MKTAMPNLHLNLSGVPSYAQMSCSTEARSDNGCQPLSTPTMPITPLDQMYASRGMQRMNSVSSTSTMMSTDDEDGMGGGDGPDMEWSQNEDDLLMNVYQDIAENPTVAPFAGRVPPSGIVQRVAKQVLKRAPREGMSFQHSLGHVRRRLLVLCHLQMQQRQPRVDSPAPAPQVNFNSQFGFGNVVHNNTTGQMGTPAHSRPTTPVDQIMRNQEIHSWLMQQQQQPQLPPQQPIHAPSPPPQIQFQFPPPRTDIPRPLASPFQESLANSVPSQLHVFPPPASLQPAANDPFPNYTAHRKRESLKLKRGMNA